MNHNLPKIAFLIIFAACVSCSKEPDPSKYSKWITYTDKNSGLADTMVSTIAIDSAGNKWIATQKGVSKFNNTTWITYTTSNSSLVNNTVKTITVDRAGSVWLLPYSGGVTRFRNGQWDSWMQNYGINYVTFNDLGETWFGHGTDITKYDSTLTTDNWTGYFISYDIILNATDPLGNLWLVKSNGDVIKFNNHVLATNSHMTVSTVKCLIVDDLENFWFGTSDQGIVRIYKGSSTGYNTKNGLPGNNVTAIYIDKSGKIWAATDEGLSKFNNGTWTTYTHKNNGLPDYPITCITGDNNGTIWISTNGGGVARSGD